MSDLNLHPEFEKQIRAAMDVPDPSPDFLTGLRKQLLSETKKSIIRPAGGALRPSLRWGLATLAILVAVLLAVGPGKVASAFRTLFGYIPGIGIVSQEPSLRILAEPVIVERGGITVTVEQGVLDSSRTVVLYQVEGIPQAARPSEGSVSACAELPRLVLPDGTVLESGLGGGSGWNSGYEHRFEYPPIPDGVNNASFVIPCLMDTNPGATPENWELSLVFIPAPPDMIVFPVIEIPTPTPLPDPTITLQSEADLSTAEQGTETGIPFAGLTTSTPEADGIFLVLDRAAQLDDGYIFFATFDWQKSGYTFISPDALRLLDARGDEIPFEYVPPEGFQSSEPQQMPLAFKVSSSLTPGPLTVSIERAIVDVPVDASFTFDAGSNPKPGQEWVLNQEIDIEGTLVKVLSARAITNRGGVAYEFDMELDADLSGVMLADLEHAPIGMGGGGGGGGGGSSDSKHLFMTQILYADSLPTGSITFTVQSISRIISGPWQATWTPPEDGQAGSPSQSQDACLTSETWQQAIQQVSVLPINLDGKLALYGPAGASQEWEISVINLDGSNEQIMGAGTWPSLSPDGTRLVYSSADGLYLTDLATGVTFKLPGTNENDYSPIWSPDGMRIAFVRSTGVPGIFLVAADGSGLQQLTDDPDYEMLGGWMPDSKRLLYAVSGRDGLDLRLLDLPGRTDEDLFTIQAKGPSLSISPDGQRLVFMERMFGSRMGLYISALDSTNRQLLADAEPVVVSNPVWSPDGAWLMLSVNDPETNPDIPMLALLHVEDCQIVPLPNLNGYIFSWVP